MSYLLWNFQLKFGLRLITGNKPWRAKVAKGELYSEPYFKHTYPLGVWNSVLSGIPGILENLSGGTSFVFFPLQSVDKE